MTPPKPTPEEIKNPRRILLVAPSDETASTFLKDLTGTPPRLPDPETGSLAGVSHVLNIKTEYYIADVPIWIDIVDPDGISEWADEFSGKKAAGVLAAVGGYVVLVNRGEGKTGWDEMERVLREVDRVADAGAADAGAADAGAADAGAADAGADAGAADADAADAGAAEGAKFDSVRLAVLLGITAGEEEEIFIPNWEAVDGAATGKNEFRELVGVERVKEALEANNWSNISNQLSSGEEDVNQLEKELGITGEDVEGGFEIGEEDLEGMRRPLFVRDKEDEEDSVEEMEALMLKMQAMRDLAADMPEAEKKKFAAKAVRDFMKTF